jgi:hypothetical protein
MQIDMKKLLALISLLGIICSCHKQEKKEELIEPRTDDNITVTYISSNLPASSPAKGDFYLLGYGYDVTGEFADSSAARDQIIDVVKLDNDRPSSVVVGKGDEGRSRTIIADNCETYSMKLSSWTEATLGSRLYKGAITSFFPDQDALSEKHIYAGYTYIIQKNRIFCATHPEVLRTYLTDAFKIDIESSSPQDIVKKYGTHLLTDILLGSKLDIVYQAETVNPEREQAAKLGLTVGLNNVFNTFSGDLDNYKASSATGNFSQKISYKTTGGDPSKISQITSPGAKYPKINISDWIRSTEGYEELVDFNMDSQVLRPIYEYIEDPVKKEEVKNYIQQYLSENQVRLSK